jgi:hypothetical protein
MHYALDYNERRATTAAAAFSALKGFGERAAAAGERAARRSPTSVRISSAR